MFEPFFDQYLPSVTFNGGVPVYVPLHPPTSSSTLKSTSNDWTLNLDELRYHFRRSSSLHSDLIPYVEPRLLLAPK